MFCILYIMFQTYAHPCSTTVQNNYTSAGETKDDGPVPMIIDTDIGDDIDDAFCLTLAFKLHLANKINLLCIITSGKGSHQERAGLVLRLQRSVLGDASIPIYMGSAPGDSKRNYMSCTIPGSFDLFESSTSSVVERIRAASKQVCVLCIGPLDNVRVLLDALQDPESVRLCVMGGSFYKSFDAQPPQIAEYNVRNNIENWSYVTAHADALIVPLDVAGAARFKDWRELLPKLLVDFQEMYKTWYKSVLRIDGVGSRILAGTMSADDRPEVPGDISSVMFDAVALCIAINPSISIIVRSAVEVSERGMTNMIDGAHKVSIALEWRDSSFFERWALESS